MKADASSTSPVSEFSCQGPHYYCLIQVQTSAAPAYLLLELANCFRPTNLLRGQTSDETIGKHNSDLGLLRVFLALELVRDSLLKLLTELIKVAVEFTYVVASHTSKLNNESQSAQPHIPILL